MAHRINPTYFYPSISFDMDTNPATASHRFKEEYAKDKDTAKAKERALNLDIDDKYKY